jgi:hypothetical protein
MSENQDPIEELKSLVYELNNTLDELSITVKTLEAKEEDSVSHRMSYLTWNLANPAALIFIPTIITVVSELFINNWDSHYREWSIQSLTKSTSWSIPIVVALVGFVIAFGNKLYQLIQERGDMNIEKVLDVKLKGLNRKIERERKADQAKRDADQAKRDADQAKRDEKIEALFKEMTDVKINQVRLENVKSQ